MEIAPLGHSGSQTSQLMHWSVILRAMPSLSPGEARLGRAAPDLGLHALHRERMHEGRDIASEDRDLAHDGRREEEVLVRGREEERLYARCQPAVHAREL